jgi:hypothetical protein
MQHNAAQKERTDHLIISVEERLLKKFTGLLGPGFMIKTRIGITVKTLLCDELGLSEPYFEERIQTLFLNSRPVDDAATAVLTDGSTLALSAAMPGLVGATFRKGGRYSWMRGGISYSKKKSDIEEKSGWVTLKLFNLILKELGPYFLSTGVWLRGRVIKEFFENLNAEDIRGIRSAEFNGARIEPAALSGIRFQAERIFLKIASAGFNRKAL